MSSAELQAIIRDVCQQMARIFQTLESLGKKDSGNVQLVQRELVSFQQELRLAQRSIDGIMASDSITPLRDALVTASSMVTGGPTSVGVLLRSNVDISGDKFSATIRELRKHHQGLRAAHKTFIAEQLMATPTVTAIQLPESSRDPCTALLKSFSTSPFAAFVPPKDRNLFDSISPTTFHLYHQAFSDAGKAFVQQRANKQPGTRSLAKIEVNLFERLWSQTIYSFDTSELGWQVEQMENKNKLDTLRDHVDEGLRDALLRFKLARFSMVFVGAESAGKSAFLNAFIGRDLLPTHSECIQEFIRPLTRFQYTHLQPTRATSDMFPDNLFQSSI